MWRVGRPWRSLLNSFGEARLAECLIGRRIEVGARSTTQHGNDGGNGLVVETPFQAAAVVVNGSACLDHWSGMLAPLGGLLPSDFGFVFEMPSVLLLELFITHEVHATVRIIGVGIALALAHNGWVDDLSIDDENDFGILHLAQIDKVFRGNRFGQIEDEKPED